MILNDFITNIAQQFLDEDQSKVDASIKFRSLPTYDSLTAMAILTFIQDEYGVNIPVDDFRKMETVTELFDYVKSHK